ncbi:MAG: SUMF1/EgtB/PvdO family nonheme iron enzyme [Verrucomicrobiaceae bacterium]|nr:SUMF1/EgtB/PvdO family nonheme iron enzyme [Verrucomicrobiaceae bacterium]
MGKFRELYSLGTSVILLLLTATGCSDSKNAVAAAKEQAEKNLIAAEQKAQRELLAVKEKAEKDLIAAEQKAKTKIAKALEKARTDGQVTALELEKVRQQAAADRDAAKKATRELAIARKLSEGNLAATRKVAKAQLDAVKEKAAFEMAALKEKTEKQIAAARADVTTQLQTIKSTPAMVYVKGGEFTMGFEGIAAPEHKVTLSPFYIAKFETSYKLWLKVKSFGAANGYAFHQQGRAGTPWAPAMAGNNQPVTDICAWDALVWCNAYSEMEGFEPVYRTADNAVIRDSRHSNAGNLQAAVFDRNAKGYRLPTEAEWEYAARFRGKGDFAPGDFASGASANSSDIKATSEVAWFPFNSPAPNNHPQPVGLKKANPLGLHDMSGNVYEWCWGRQDPYQAQPKKDPVGTKAGGQVLRGGSFGHGNNELRSSHRISSNPVNFSVNVGFRCARSH